MRNSKLSAPFGSFFYIERDKRWKMIVKILDITESPCDAIALAAGTSYGKFDTSEKRVKNIIKAGHLSCTEFAYIHFRIEGISRSCLAQLTRHRLMSFCVESQRYNKYSSLMDD